MNFVERITLNFHESFTSIVSELNHATNSEMNFSYYIQYSLHCSLKFLFFKSLSLSVSLSLENVITFSPIKVFTLNFNNSFHQLLSNSIVLQTVPGESIWILNTENIYARISLFLSYVLCKTFWNFIRTGIIIPVKLIINHWNILKPHAINVKNSFIKYLGLVIY